MNGERIIAITMPKWGMAMEEGSVTAWHVDEGARIVVGQEMLDVESTKIASAIESKQSSVLRRKIASIGQTLPIGALLGVLSEDDVGENEIDSFIAQFEVNLPEDEASASGSVPQTIEVSGRTIRYVVQGEGGIPMLMVHGFGGDLNAWMFNQSVLAADRAVYALDLPGHGGSSKLVGDGGLSVLAESVAAVMVASNADRVHLVGHSLGGAVALLVALNNPNRVKSLTLIAAAGIGSEINGSYISGFIAAQRRKDMKPIASMLFSDPSIVGHQMVEDLLRMKRVSGVESALKTIADANFEGDKQKISLVDRARQLDIPIQVVWGRNDSIMPAAHANNLPEAKITILEGAGHMLMMEKANELNAIITEFTS